MVHRQAVPTIDGGLIKINRLIRSRRKTVALVITADATLVVRAPLDTPLRLIEEAVFAKKRWIHRKIQEIIKAGGPPAAKRYIDQEPFVYLGQTYHLRLVQQPSISLTSELLFPPDFVPQGRAKMIEWYWAQAQSILPRRVDYFSQLTGWRYSSLRISGAEKRWGSCNQNGAISLSWKLVMAPMEIIDYVVVHELAHLKEHNHSSKFWGLVQHIIPEYKDRRKWLRQHQTKLRV